MRGRRMKFAILFAAAMVCANGQWLNYPAPGTPRTRDGKPNLSAPAPHLSNGKPDLSGVWLVEAPAPGVLERMVGDLSVFVVPGDDPRTFSPYFFNILGDFKRGEEPVRPEAAAVLRTRAERHGVDFPGTRCLPVGIPAATFIAVPFKIIHSPGLMAMLYEVDSTFRQIYTDGRKLPAELQPAWLGYSVGKWEGDTLVVDTAGFNDLGWLDAFGHPRSEALRVKERFRRRDFGHMEVQITIDDAKNYTKPFTVKVNHLLVPDSDILESFCTENEKDRTHFVLK
jgi:hypothetical protein